MAFQQYDLCRLPDDTLVVVLQSDLIQTSQSRVVAPLVRAHLLQPMIRGLNPTVTVGEAEYRIALHALTAVRVVLLRGPLATATHLRDEITRGLDLLFTGV